MANRNFARAMRRKTEWAGFGSEGGAAALPAPQTIAAAASAILSNGAVVAGGTGFVDQEVTITRTIGTAIAKIAAGTVSLEGEFAIGLLVARNEAVTAGVASMPSPVTDPDAEWLYHISGQLIRGLTANIDDGIATVRIPFDVRGQRVLRAGSNVVWIGAAEGTTLDLGVTGRYLVKLA